MSDKDLYELVKQANSLRFQGCYKKALIFFGKALTLSCETFGGLHKDTATIQSYIGMVYKSLGEYEKAENSYHNALTSYLKILEKNSPIIAKLYNHMGLCLSSQEKFDEALVYYEKSLQSYVVILGKEKTIVTATYNNMGLVFDLNQDYNEALENFERALHTKLTSLNTNHPESRVNYSANDSIYKSKLNFYKSYAFLQKDIDKELESKNSCDLTMATRKAINIKNTFKNRKKTFVNKKTKSL